ncbi:MAG: response regulator [Treponema sp.]|nr:response regulator [Treponema sp.]
MPNLKDVIRAISEKSRTFNTIYIQMLIIIISFIIMGSIGIVLASRIVNKQLVKDAEFILAVTEAELGANLLEPETFLGDYSFTIRNMILSGESDSAVFSYMKSMTDSIVNDSERLLWVTNTYGYFFYWGGRRFSVNGVLPDEFLLHENPWYQSAIDARGHLAISGPYRDTVSGNYHLTFSQLISDEDSAPLAVICLDVDIDRFNKHINVDLTDGSYGILLNENREILAHQNRNFLGYGLASINSDIARFSFHLTLGNEIFNRRAGNTFNTSIVFIRKMQHGWYFCISIPEFEYYNDLVVMVIYLVITGLILTIGLCAMIYYISLAKAKSDRRTRQKSNFLATMSHEIRTPLNAILGMTEIQMQNLKHPPAISESFIKINNSGKLLLNIINDILDLSKIESGKLELIPVKYEVASLINDIIQLNYIRYEDKPIEFKIDVDENLPAILVGDELRIKQIMNNLLSNAFKYTNKGEVRLFVNAECVGRGGGAVLVTLVFRVEDTGQGMTPDQLNKLFDEYTRFNLEANRATEGAGLGMTITQNLVNLMYGKISVKSAPDEGTSVTVRLPQKTHGTGIRGVIGKQTAENLKLLKHDSTLQLKRARIFHEYMPYGRILIVDDVETNLYVAQGLMAPYGLKIDLATSGFEAVDKVKEGNIYDIIFMDHMMPKMDGIEAARIIHCMGYTRPIVALTANALTGQVDMFLNSGFDDFISKPIDSRLLNTLLNKLIRDKQPYEILEAARKERMEKQYAPDDASQKVNSNLAQIFTRDAEKAINILKTCMQNNLHDENEIQMYIINVHAMKSALANIGEDELSAAARRLEQAGRERDINVLVSETGTFLDNLSNVVSEINRKNTNRENAEDTQESLVFLNEKLKTIMEACETLDKKSAKNALNEIKEKTWSHNTNELLNTVSNHLLHSEFDDIAACILEFLNK